MRRNMGGGRPEIFGPRIPQRAQNVRQYRSGQTRQPVQPPVTGPPAPSYSPQRSRPGQSRGVTGQNVMAYGQSPDVAMVRTGQGVFGEPEYTPLLDLSPEEQGMWMSYFGQERPGYGLWHEIMSRPGQF